MPIQDPCAIRVNQRVVVPEANGLIEVVQRLGPSAELDVSEGSSPVTCRNIRTQLNRSGEALNRFVRIPFLEVAMPAIKKFLGISFGRILSHKEILTQHEYQFEPHHFQKILDEFCPVGPEFSTKQPETKPPRGTPRGGSISKQKVL